MVSRRGFLTDMLALGAAPAIVRVENLMRLWVPPQELFVYDLSNGPDEACLFTARKHMDGADEFVLIIHPSTEVILRELAFSGNTRVICKREVLRHD